MIDFEVVSSDLRPYVVYTLDLNSHLCKDFSYFTGSFGTWSLSGPCSGPSIVEAARSCKGHGFMMWKQPQDYLLCQTSSTKVSGLRDKWILNEGEIVS